MAQLTDETPLPTADHKPVAGQHQTITRVTRILEEVVSHPGSTLPELTRAVDAPKSSVYGFIRGLLAVDWLIEQDRRFYLGPAFYSLAIATGHVRAGLVTTADLDNLHEETGLTTTVGVRAGDHLIYIAEASTDLVSTFRARSNIRRNLLHTAGGRVLLALMPESELATYLSQRSSDEQADIEAFLEERDSIRATRVSVNVRDARSRTGVATAIFDANDRPVATLTVSGPTTQVLPRVEELRELVKARVAEWHARSASSNAREPI